MGRFGDKCLSDLSFVKLLREHCTGDKHQVSKKELLSNKHETNTKKKYPQ